MYKIFINEKPFVISETDIEGDFFAKCKRVEYNPAKTLEYIKEAETMKSKGFLLITDDVEFAIRDFYTHFVPMEAAGGVVFNQLKEILLIKRLGKWDLPKGKIDEGETSEIAAVREVEEECKVYGLKIVKQLPTTYHTYKMHNHRFLKITYWYEMQTAWDKKPVPQLEEQITEADWFDLTPKKLETLDTYLSIYDLLNSAIK